MDNDHSKYHSSNAFCGNAGLEEMRHMHSLVDKLTEGELKRLVKGCEIDFIANEEDLTREDYEGVVDEADREDFYRVYEVIMNSRKEKSKKLDKISRSGEFVQNPNLEITHKKE